MTCYYLSTTTKKKEYNLHNLISNIIFSRFLKYSLKIFKGIQSTYMKPYLQLKMFTTIILHNFLYYIQ